MFGSSIVLSKNGATAYIAGYGPLVNGNPSTFPLPGLTIVNVSTNSILHQTTIDGGIDAGALGADQTRYYGLGEDVNGNELFVFDATSGALLQTIPMPEQFSQIVVNPNGTVGYLPGTHTYQINFTTGTLTTLCTCSGALAIDATGSKLFAIQQNGITILNATTGVQIGTIAKPSNVYLFLPGNVSSASIEAGNLGSFVVGENNNDGSYSDAVVSTSSDSIVNTVASQPYLGGQTPAVNEAGNYAVLMSQGSGSASPVGAVALPYSQLYFFRFMSTANSYDASAAQ